MLSYSKTTRGFYDSEIHGDAVPTDAVEITAEEHMALLNAQAAGKAIVPDVDGRPIAVDQPPPGPPASVTMRQARLALLAGGKLAGVVAAIDALPSPQREAAQIEWEFAATVERASPLVGLLVAALSLDDAQLDALFISAGAL